jgi:hypothetical protein
LCPGPRQGSNNRQRRPYQRLDQCVLPSCCHQ